MKRKIFTGVVSVSLVIMLICVGLVTEILYDYMGQKLDDELVSEATCCTIARLTPTRWKIT